MCMMIEHPPSATVAAFEARMRSKYGIVTTMAPPEEDTDATRKAQTEATIEALLRRAREPSDGI